MASKEIDLWLSAKNSPVDPRHIQDEGTAGAYWRLSYTLRNGSILRMSIDRPCDGENGVDMAYAIKDSFYDTRSPKGGWELKE